MSAATPAGSTARREGDSRARCEGRRQRCARAASTLQVPQAQDLYFCAANKSPPDQSVQTSTGKKRRRRRRCGRCISPFVARRGARRCRRGESF
ncbi:unnamed protein product, partial [Phaeothamnion confervicola]